MELTGTGEIVSSLENFFKFNDAVIRFMTVKIEKKKIVKKSAKDVKPDEAELQAKHQAVEGKQDESTEQ